MSNIRYPNITGKTPEEKIAQMERYLRQLVDVLNWTLSQTSAAQSGMNSNKGGK